MQIDATIRFDLFQIALLCGGLLAAYRVLLVFGYPLLSGALWQHIFGPMVEARWKGSAQCEDHERPSYMPLQDDKPYVMAWGLLPPPIDALTHGVRDGFLLGVLAALVPETMPLILTLTLAITIGIGAWRISKNHGAARVDHVFWAFRNVLIYIGAIAAMHATQLW
ncbi:hypothetical protein ACEXTD_003032 [Salmonella enterica]